MMDYMQYFMLTFIVTCVAIFLLLKTRLVNIALDRPNARSLHNNVIPRTGGLGIMLGVLTVWMLMAQMWIWLVLPLLLVIVSLIDDVRELTVSWRLLAQLLVCSIFVWITATDFAWWAMFLVVLALTWMVNLYNFMDGSDGLAGGMTLFGFGAYGIAAFLSNDMNFSLMSGCIVTAAFAFLLFNFHPARIFMGDAGSVPLGFLAGAMGLYGWQHDLWQAWFPVVVFSPFIVDATVTLLKRLVHRERLWEAHRSHFYQRLVQMGWGHRKTAIAEYVLMFLVGASALLLLKSSTSLILIGLLFWLFLYLIIMWMIDKRWLKLQHLEGSF
ncbi:MAG: glycosyltransferase family 4 protein [Candidatus Methylopumilus sp.]|jgi:UDP-N-acetylmuramyl pentapeptide phosphotransferase/UDP-N-acetylglucosamine-1-phosphate transferase